MTEFAEFLQVVKAYQPELMLVLSFLLGGFLALLTPFLAATAIQQYFPVEVQQALVLMCLVSAGLIFFWGRAGEGAGSAGPGASQ